MITDIQDMTNKINSLRFIKDNRVACVDKIQRLQNDIKCFGDYPTTISALDYMIFVLRRNDRDDEERFRFFQRTTLLSVQTDTFANTILCN